MPMLMCCAMVVEKVGRQKWNLLVVVLVVGVWEEKMGKKGKSQLEKWGWLVGKKMAPSSGAS